MTDESQRFDDHDRDYVKSLLEALGFQPDVIAEASHPTPDLSLPLSTGRALIEVKSKDDDRQLRRVVDSAPGTARAYSNSSIETKLRHGWHQIRNLRASPSFLLIKSNSSISFYGKRLHDYIPYPKTAYSPSSDLKLTATVAELRMSWSMWFVFAQFSLDACGDKWSPLHRWHSTRKEPS